MLRPGSKKGTIRFEFSAPSAQQVMLAGTFNDWQPRPMRRQAGGRFMAVQAMGPGMHEYKFVVDGRWEPDPDNNHWSVNVFGTINSVVAVAAAQSAGTRRVHGNS